MDLPEACLFDLDGVLLDTEPLHGKAWFKSAENFGFKLSNKQLIELRGRRRQDCAKQICEWMTNKTDIDELLSIHKPISRLLLGQAKAIPGAEDLIQWCHKNKMKMALVSSSTSESIAYKSAPHPWLGLITTRVLGNDPSLKKGKPAPDPFLLAAQKLQTNPTSCWALEDSKAGTTSALSAGCKVWVIGNQQKPITQKQNANPIHIRNLKIVLDILMQKKHSV